MNRVKFYTGPPVAFVCRSGKNRHCPFFFNYFYSFFSPTLERTFESPAVRSPGIKDRLSVCQVQLTARRLPLFRQGSSVQPRAIALQLSRFLPITHRRVFSSFLSFLFSSVSRNPREEEDSHQYLMVSGLPFARNRRYTPLFLRSTTARGSRQYATSATQATATRLHVST